MSEETEYEKLMRTNPWRMRWEWIKINIECFFWQFHPRRNRWCDRCGHIIGNSKHEASKHQCKETPMTLSQPQPSKLQTDLDAGDAAGEIDTKSRMVCDAIRMSGLRYTDQHIAKVLEAFADICALAKSAAPPVQSPDDAGETVKETQAVQMTPKEREDQRRSFAYGNANLSNPSITRSDIDAAAERLNQQAGAMSEAEIETMAAEIIDRLPAGSPSVQHVIRLANAARQAIAQRGEPIGYVFELAGAIIHPEKTWTQWAPPQFSFTKPNVPEGSIRNLKPVYCCEGVDTELLNWCDKVGHYDAKFDSIREEIRAAMDAHNQS